MEHLALEDVLIATRNLARFISPTEELIEEARARPHVHPGR